MIPLEAQFQNLNAETIRKHLFLGSDRPQGLDARRKSRRSSPLEGLLNSEGVAEAVGTRLIVRVEQSQGLRPGVPATGR